ncbi:hypothetical protein ACS0TY_022438 [Phlomoides rotata]
MELLSRNSCKLTIKVVQVRGVTVWEPIKAHWLDPNVIARSEQCSRNRRSELGGPGTGMSCHKGGSRGVAEVAREIERNTDSRLQIGRS